MIEQFNYSVRVLGDLQALVHGDLANALENTHELQVTSGNFDDYTRCASAASRLLSGLAASIAKKTGQDYVIVLKKNPAFEDGADPTEPVEGWDRLTVVKMYATDAKTLRDDSTLAPVATAEVNVSTDGINTIKSYSNQTKH